MPDHSRVVAASASNASAIRTKASADRNSAHNLSSSSVPMPMTRANVVQTGKTPVLAPRAMARANVVFTVFLRGMSLQGLEYRSDSRRYGVPSHVVFFHCSNSTTKRRRVWGTPHTSSSIASHSSRGSVYALGVTTCSCGFVPFSSASTISQPRRASPLGVMPIISA